MNVKTKKGVFIVFLIASLLVGGVISELLGLILPRESVAEKVLISPLYFEFPVHTIDLSFCSLDFGFSLNLKPIIFLVVGIALYYLKYSL